MDTVLKRHCKLLSFSTIIFSVFFLYDLASPYQISSNRDHLRRIYDVISIFQDIVGNLFRASVLVTALV